MIAIRSIGARVFCCICLALVGSSIVIGSTNSVFGSEKRTTIPSTLSGLKELMGKGYECLERDNFLVASDLDLSTLLSITSRDFMLYDYILRRDFFTKPQKKPGKQGIPKLVVFLFKNKESYLAGLNIVRGDIIEREKDTPHNVRGGYFFYNGRGRNYTVINYREDYAKGLSIFSHELSHFLMQNDSSGDPPTWINEGIATMVGNTTIVNSHLRFASNPGLRRMHKTLEKKTTLSLDALLKLGSKDFLAPDSRHYYDAAEQFCRFLHSRNLLTRVYHDLRDNLKDDPDGRKTIMKLTRSSIDDLGRTWHTWMEKQE